MSAPSVLFDAPGPKARLRYRILAVVGAVLIVALLLQIISKMSAAGQLDPAMWSPFLTASAWTDYLVPGILGTLKATVLSVLFAGIFGLLFGMGRLSDHKWLSWPCGMIVEFFRAVPVLIMMIFLFAILNQAGIFPSEVNPLAAVVIALTVYNGSVIAELVRSGVFALPKGQREAGLSIGLTPHQVLRSIELPQALVAMLPATIAQLVVVLKDSALGYAITYQDLVTWAKTLGSANANVVPSYLVAGLLFLLMNAGLTHLSHVVERRLRRAGHTAAPITEGEATVVTGTGEPGVATATTYDGTYKPGPQQREDDLHPADLDEGARTHAGEN